MHILDKNQFHILTDILGYIFKIVPVSVGKNHFFDSGAAGGEYLLLETADGEDTAGKAYFTCHGHVTPSQTSGHQGYNRCDHGDPRRRAILGDASGRHMYVY